MGGARLGTSPQPLNAGRFSAFETKQGLPSRTPGSPSLVDYSVGRTMDRNCLWAFAFHVEGLAAGPLQRLPPAYSDDLVGEAREFDDWPWVSRSRPRSAAAWRTKRMGRAKLVHVTPGRPVRHPAMGTASGAQGPAKSGEPALDTTVPGVSCGLA